MTPLEKEQFERVNRVLQKLSHNAEYNSDLLNDFIHTPEEMNNEEMSLVSEIVGKIVEDIFIAKTEFTLLKQHFEGKR